MRLWSNVEKHPLTPNLLFYIEDTEDLHAEAVEKLSDCAEKLKIEDTECGGPVHGPVMQVSQMI